MAININSRIAFLAFLIVVVAASLSEAAAERSIFKLVAKRRSLLHLKEQSRSEYSATNDKLRGTALIEALLIEKGRRTTVHNTTVLLAPPCKRSFKFIYVPPSIPMKLKSASKGGFYPNNSICGWWFWTDDGYQFDMFCRKIKMKPNDYFVVINEDTSDRIEYQDVKLIDVTLDFGNTNDLVVGMETDSTPNGKGFKCMLNTTVSPPNPNCRCGVPNDAPSAIDTTPSPVGLNRIIGGTVSTSQPWTAALKDSETSTTVMCTATIIHSEWLITSAVCVDGSGLDWVSVGMLDSTASATTYITLPILQTVLHTNFVVNIVAEYNVALLRVAPMTFTDVVSPICLPVDISNTYAADTVTVAGWGAFSATSTGGSSSLLRELDISVVTNAECNTAYAQTPLAGLIIDYSLCAGDPTGATYPCHRDWGSPLMFDAVSGNVELIAVLSGTIQCHLAAVFPDLYTRVTEVLDWIYLNIDVGTFCPRTV